MSKIRFSKQSEPSNPVTDTAWVYLDDDNRLKLKTAGGVVYDLTSVGSMNALVGSDGLTVTSGSSTVTLQGFRTEFVSASGSLSNQISLVQSLVNNLITDEIEPAIISGNSSTLTVTSGTHATTLTVPVGKAIIGDSFITVASGINAIYLSSDAIVAGSSNLTVTSGSNTVSLNLGTTISTTNGAFSGGLTVSGVPVMTAAPEGTLNITMKGGTSETWSNMPTAATLFDGFAGIVQLVDLTKKTQARLVHVRGNIAGSANSRLFLRYSPTFSSTATVYTGMGGDSTFGTPYVPLTSTNTVEDSDWQTLIPAARSEVYIALVGSGGNGATDPVFGSIVAMFR